MNRPVIGISTYLVASARWGVWDLPATLLPAGYARLVREAGGLAVLLPPDGPECAASVVARLDAVVVAGGIAALTGTSVLCWVVMGGLLPSAAGVSRG